MAWLVPGAGFWLRGYKKRAVFTFFSIGSLFFLGLLMRGNIIPQTIDIMSISGFIGSLGNGILSLGYLFVYLLTRIIGDGLKCKLGNFSEIGRAYLTISGALNLLIVCKLNNFIKISGKTPKSL
jgi:hypothetical protein